jgi:hypothetical protein
LFYYSDIQKYTDSDKVFSGFASSCTATPQNCALASLNATAWGLEELLYDFLEGLKFDPLYIAGTVVDWTSVVTVIFQCLYNPTTWKQLAESLYGFITGNATDASWAIEFYQNSLTSSNEHLHGIECSDKVPRASNLSDLAPDVEELYQKSYFADSQTITFTRCAQWRMEAKEIYSGNFQVKTANPILLIGNTYDPVTPFVSAQNVSETFDGSVLLQHNGYGVSNYIVLSRHRSITPG